MRLPYGIKCQYITIGCNPKTFEDIVETQDDTIVFIEPDIYNVFLYEEGTDVDIENIRPYLRPLSSMTEEERKELSSQMMGDKCDEDGVNIDVTDLTNLCIYYSYFPLLIDWFNAHYFDYRGLIEKNLAIEAPVGMYK